MVIESRRSPLQGVLIQPSRISQDSHGWDNRQSSLETGVGFYAPVTALPFGTAMHPEQCGCEGCKQEGISGMSGLGAEASLFSKLPVWAPLALAVAAGLIVYKYARS